MLRTTKHVSKAEVDPVDRVTLPPGGGGHFRNFWGGMCRWKPGTLNLDKIFNQLISFLKNDTLFWTQTL